MKAWNLAARPKTLSASVVPVVVGTALTRSIHWPTFPCALLGAIFIQIGTNLVNDALDFKRGADTADRLGPLRVTQAGLLSAKRVKQWTLADVLPQLKQPFLILHGENDLEELFFRLVS